MKFTPTFSAVALMAQAFASSCSATREIGGVEVIDTPLVRAAEAYAREYSNDAIYGHIMRSWLYGVLMIQANETLGNTVDLELHAVSAILHDLGWDQTPGSPVITPDRRFEVDGAFAAREFIEGHEDGSTWDDRRLQLVWDSIALHAIPSIADFKEIDVQVVSQGIRMDFFGPLYGVKQEDYDRVNEAFPKDTFLDGVDDAIIWLCQSKPATTFGESQPTADMMNPKLTICVIQILGSSLGARILSRDTMPPDSGRLTSSGLDSFRVFDVSAFLHYTSKLQFGCDSTLLLFLPDVTLYIVLNREPGTFWTNS